MTSLPVVLVHGFMGGSSQWELQKEYFGTDRELITPDLPGFGLNSHLDSPNKISGFANYILDDLDKKGIDRFILLGHSMGGMIVQEMMALQPERVERLILYGTAATGNLPNRFETFETSRKRLIEDGVQSTARRISATWFLENENADQYKNCASIAESASLQAMLAGLDAMEQWSRTEHLEKIVCPTLIIWGDRDRTYGCDQVYELWRTIPNADLAAMPGCAHAAHLEKPYLFNVILNDFLGSGIAREASSHSR